MACSSCSDCRMLTATGRNSMRWSYAVGMSLTIALGVAAGSRDAVAQASLKDQLVGTWTIVAQVQTLPDGTTRKPSGDNPKGVNIFTADGQFVVLFMRDDLPKIAA